MDVSSRLTKLLHDLSEENYDRTFSTYRSWIGHGAAHGGMPNDKLYQDILISMKPESIQAPHEEQMRMRQGNMPLPPDWVDSLGGRLIHNDVHLLPRFISDAELDPILSTYAIGLHNRLCRESLEQFFRQNLDYIPKDGSTGPTSEQRCVLYTRVNLIAHWVNLGYVGIEDVRDRILQSLVNHPAVHIHQLHSLMILLKLSGATFAAYVDPSVMDRCRLFLGLSHLISAGLAEHVLQLWKGGWEGLPPPPVLHSAEPITVPKPQDPTVTPIATSLGLPGTGEQSQPPTLPAPAPEIPSDEIPNSSAPPSPPTSITTLSDFTIPDNLDDESALESETITHHDMFYLADGSAEVLCGKTLFRIHAGALSFHSPVLRQMFSPANLTAIKSPNGCPRIVSSDTPTDFAALLKVVYLPEFQDRSRVPDFSTFSSLLRVSSHYEMTNLRARLLQTIHQAYPESFEGLDPSKALGENVFEEPKPHPNAVLNLFVQQKVTSALPVAYYMAARRGLGSLMDTRLLSSATLSGQMLRSSIQGLMALREMELKETHRIIFTVKDTSNRVSCSSTDCPSRRSKGLLDAETIEAHQRTFDRITGSAVGGTRILQAPSESEFVEDMESKFCHVCAKKMQTAHAEVRRRAWAVLPEVFGLTKK